MPGQVGWLGVGLAVFAALAVVTTVWSVVADLRIYRGWKGERTGPQPRWKRRQQQRHAAEEDQDAKRWGWHILALKCSAFGFAGGMVGLVVGYLARTAWLMVTGGNLLVLGVMTWIAYQLVLPKPTALREKRLPAWLNKKR